MVKKMKSKILQIILIAFIIFMIGGIFNSISEIPSDDVGLVTSEFDNLSEFDTSGYTSEDPFNEEKVNNIAKFNGKIGNFISTSIKKIINFFFDIIKKFVS